MCFEETLRVCGGAAAVSGKICFGDWGEKNHGSKPQRWKLGRCHGARFYCVTGLMHNHLEPVHKSEASAPPVKSEPEQAGAWLGHPKVISRHDGQTV